TGRSRSITTATGARRSLRRFRASSRATSARINNYEIYSIGGEVAVDFVGRYENLDADLRHALGQVGLALDRDLPRAKTTFRKSDKPYRAYYDDETRGIVGDWYQREIALLDYAF